MTSPPILIIGPPRSGTTLLATMLNAHSHIFVANEAKVFVNLLPRARFQGLLTGSTVRSILRDLEANELAQSAPLPYAENILQRVEQPLIHLIIRELFQILAEREGKVRWGEKTAVAYRQLDTIRRAYPDAHLLALDRSPADIAASYDQVIPKWGALGGLMHWLDFRRTLQMREGSEVLLVPYQELITDTQRTLERVCDFVHEQYEDGMLAFHRTTRAHRLRSSELFGGSGKPLYVRVHDSRAVASGMRGRLVARCLRAGDDPRGGPQFWERVLRVLLSVRALFWELRQPGLVRRIIREGKLRI